MNKLFITLIITLVFALPAFSSDLGNKININEFPMSENVLPDIEVNADFVISGLSLIHI